MPPANALKSIGYTDTVLFLTIGKPDIYQHEGFGKSAAVFLSERPKITEIGCRLT